MRVIAASRVAEPAFVLCHSFIVNGRREVDYPLFGGHERRWHFVDYLGQRVTGETLGLDEYPFV